MPYYDTISGDRKNNGGKVKPIENALVCDRNLENSEFVQVTHTTYITFVCDEIAYYFQVDQNPFSRSTTLKRLLEMGNIQKTLVLMNLPKMVV